MTTKHETEQGRRFARVTPKIAVTAAISALAAVAIAAPMASADGASPSGIAKARAEFRAQAVDEGLTGSQATALQARVDRLIAQDGGKQSAANEISYKDGRLLLPLPGEKYAREMGSGLNGNDPATARHTCTYKAMCGYSGRGYTGEEREWFSCGTLHKKPSSWRSGGSWYNNQTAGRVASWYNYNKQWLSNTPAAPYGANGNWAPVGYVRAC
ncbi:hypothetical protein [Streptomyces huasconensis]|uniref:hypothetical protein n=1 Tax=Streptomyces huasconensis TaxID=1854574 RepID=UPI0033CDAC80